MKNSVSTSELKSQIGEFVVEFESICAFQRGIICLISNPQSDNDLNIYLGTLMVGQTANPLNSSCQAIVNKWDKETGNILKKAFTLFSKVIEQRNFLLHGTYLLGLNLTSKIKPIDEDYLTIQKSIINKEGFINRRITVDKNELRNIIDDLILIKLAFQSAFQFVEMCIYSGPEEYKDSFSQRLQESIKVLPNKMRALKH